MSNSKSVKTLTLEQLKQAPESDYMNDEQLTFFRDLLEELYKTTSQRIDDAKSEMARPLEDFGDANDRASLEEQSRILLRIADREQKLLPKIQQSLKRIADGSYGYCLESDEPIGIPRLLIRPTAEYCADVKADKESKEDHFRN